MNLRQSIGIFTVAGLLGSAGAADAQTYVRAPFVRVQVGGPGVYVRAPFVSIFVPRSEPVYVMPRPGNGEVLPKPRPLPNSDQAPPQAVQPNQGPTLEQFGKTFQPKAGNYELEIINPVTKRPTTVRFSLPEGTPRRVHVRRNEIEFDYGPRRFVRIEFDRDGAIVTTR